jgi:hypothetical protein
MASTATEKSTPQKPGGSARDHGDLLSGKPQDYAYRKSSVPELKFEQGWLGDRFPAGTSELAQAKVSLAHEQSVKPAGYLEITLFGKLHYVSPALYERDAESFHLMHWKQAWRLHDSIRSNQAVYDEWANPRNFFVHTAERTVALYRSWFDDVEKAPKPDVEEFHQLVLRTIDLIGAMAEWDLSADRVAQNGLDLERIEEDFRRLQEKVGLFRGRAIRSAEQVVGLLETVEGTAFQVLNIVPTLTFMDPFREAAYRIGILLLRMGARACGGWLATETVQGAVDQLIAVLRREAAPVIVDCIMAPLNRLFGRSGANAGSRFGRLGKAALRQFLRALVQQIIEFVCEYIRLVIAKRDQEITRQDLEDLLSDRVVGLVSNAVGLLLPTNLGTSARMFLLRSITDSVISSILRECNEARKIHRDHPERSMVEILLADLPGILMRLVQTIIIGLAQRRAEQSREYLEQQRATRGAWGTNYEESAEILHQTQASEWARRGRPSRRLARAIQKRRNRSPVRRFTWAEYQRHWKPANIDYLSAQALRRYADNNDLVVSVMIPKSSRTPHTATPDARGAKAPKPMELKAKTCNHPDAPEELKGLVVRPMRQAKSGKPTHADLEKALKIWNTEKQKYADAGYMVRPDGVVFHPDQLLMWKQLRPEDAAACDAAIATLRELSAGGTYDLTEAVPTFPGGEAAAERVTAALGLLGRAEIGFYSDLDLVEVVDFHTGRRRFEGDLAGDEAALELAKDNRDHANANLNIHDYDDTQIPDDCRKLARAGDAVQHGGNNELVSRNVDPGSILIHLDQLLMAFPNGEIVILDEAAMRQRGYRYGSDTGSAQGREARKLQLDKDIRREYEKELQKRLGKRYRTFRNRAETVRRTYDVETQRIKSPVKGKRPPQVTSRQVANNRKAFQRVTILDEKGLGYPVGEQDIQASLKSRGLSLDTFDVIEATHDRDHNAIDQATTRHKTFLGIDEGRTSIVIAVSHYRQSLAEAVKALLLTREALGPVRADAKVWYEAYSAYAPVASGHVRDRIGGRDPGVDKVRGPVRERVSCFRVGQNERFHAFVTSGFVETYSPAAPQQARRASKVRSGEFAGDGEYFAVEDDEPPREHDGQDERSVQGLLLGEVWEDKKTKRFRYVQRTLTDEGSHIVIFPDSTVTSQADAERR